MVGIYLPRYRPYAFIFFTISFTTSLLRVEVTIFVHPSSCLFLLLFYRFLTIVLPRVRIFMSCPPLLGIRYLRLQYSAIPLCSQWCCRDHPVAFVLLANTPSKDKYRTPSVRHETPPAHLPEIEKMFSCMFYSGTIVKSDQYHNLSQSYLIIHLEELERLSQKKRRTLV